MPRYQKPSSSTIAEVGKQSFALVSLQNLSWVYEIRSGREMPLELGPQGLANKLCFDPYIMEQGPDPRGELAGGDLRNRASKAHLFIRLFFPERNLFLLLFRILFEEPFGAVIPVEKISYKST